MCFAAPSVSPRFRSSPIKTHTKGPRKMTASSTPTSALAVEWWPIEKAVPYARNARICPESAVAKVAGSIHEFGFKNPILVDTEGVIIAGHTRLLAAQRLELKQ